MKSTVTKYSAGSRSWRTNNPGLLPANEITWPYGAIGEALGVAVFRDPDSGRRALRGYLAHDNNTGRTADDLLRGFLLTRYTPPPRETDPVTGEPLPWLEPETGLDLEQPPGGSQIPQLADLIERRLGYHPGVITKEPLDTGTLNEAARTVDASPGNVLFNGRSAVHTGSGGQVCTVDICETPSGHGCKPRTYGNYESWKEKMKSARSVEHAWGVNADQTVRLQRQTRSTAQAGQLNHDRNRHGKWRSEAIGQSLAQHEGHAGKDAYTGNHPAQTSATPLFLHLSRTYRRQAVCSWQH